MPKPVCSCSCDKCLLGDHCHILDTGCEVEVTETLDDLAFLDEEEA